MLAHSTQVNESKALVSPRFGAAHRIATRSQELLPLMQEYGLALTFSEPSESGLCIADATRNPTSAFKIRGALAKVIEVHRSGQDTVITASAGNHGAGVARAAELLGMQAIIYVPENAPQVKVRKIESFGGTVIKVGCSFDESLAHSKHDVRLRDGRASFVHPFDDLTVVAGQGTIGLEILEYVERVARQRPFERVRLFVPVGGGGLLAGIASSVKTLWKAGLPRPEIVGVIDESSPAALLGTFFGRPVCAMPDTIADGTKVAMIGGSFLSVSQLVDYMILVRHDEIVSAMRHHELETLTQIEGAGALALAGESVARDLKLFNGSGKTLSIALISGRNVDPETFHKEVTGDARLDTNLHVRQAFDVKIPEREGELLHFLQTVQRFNIASLSYKQRPGESTGRLMVEFELSRSAIADLTGAISRSFPGSKQTGEAGVRLHRVGAPVANEYHDQLIILDDRPGSFLRCVEKFSAAGSFGSVGFLFYRKPADIGHPAQVVLGRSLPPPLHIAPNTAID